MSTRLAAIVTDANDISLLEPPVANFWARRVHIDYGAPHKQDSPEAHGDLSARTVTRAVASGARTLSR